MTYYPKETASGGGMSTRKILIGLFLIVFCLNWSIRAEEAKPKTSLAGDWQTTTAKNVIKLKITADGKYKWDKEDGRWMTQKNQIWFLAANNTGCKWDFAFEKGELVLSKPEDFRYEGAGKYFYFQMTNPKTVHRFSKAKK
jgi:hypothetical protein